MKPGDRVKKDKVLRNQGAVGIIEKITNDYVVVKWDNINGHWHYTFAQAEKLEIINEGR